MRIKTIKLISLFGTLLLALSAVSVQAETPKRGGTLVWSIGTTPRHLNPAVQSGIATGAPGAQLFATLVRFDDKWNAHPYLAKSWQTSADGLTVTFNLVEGATFHDGKLSPRRMWPFPSRRSRRIIPLKPCSAQSRASRRQTPTLSYLSYRSHTRH